MNQLDTLLQLFDETISECREIIVAKNHDYTSGSNDTLANFRASEALGVDPGIGILIRCMDKFKRIQTFIEQGTLQVKGESVDDAIRDVINYLILLQLYVEEQQLENLQ